VKILSLKLRDPVRNLVNPRSLGAESLSSDHYDMRLEGGLVYVETKVPSPHGMIVPMGNVAHLIYERDDPKGKK
jgi:hypothetical protein